MNSVNILAHYFISIHFNITSSSMPQSPGWFLIFRFSDLSCELVFIAWVAQSVGIVRLVYLERYHNSVIFFAVLESKTPFHLLKCSYLCKILNLMILCHHRAKFSSVLHVLSNSMYVSIPCYR